MEAKNIPAEIKRNIFTVKNIELLATHSCDENVSKLIVTKMLDIFLGRLVDI
jgi:hypothetical protein